MVTRRSTRQAAEFDFPRLSTAASYDRDLEPEERLRFARDEEAPDFDPAKAPSLPSASWPRAKKLRDGICPIGVTGLIARHGLHDAAYLGGITGRLIGMQFYAETAGALGYRGQAMRALSDGS